MTDDRTPFDERRAELEARGIDAGEGRNFDDLIRFRDGAPPWIQEAFGAMLSYETGAYLDAYEVRPFDEWEHVLIEHGPDEGDHWTLTVTYKDSETDVIDFGHDGASAWDLWGYVDYVLEGIEAEQGDMDY